MNRQIVILLDDRSFEYDIYTLVKAFFRGSEVRVCDLGEDAGTSSEASGDMQDAGFSPETAVRESEALSAGSKAAAGTGPEKKDLTERADIRFDLSVRKEQIRISITESGEKREAVLTPPEGADRAWYKNAIKRRLYEMLREMTGEKLPWGDLTGIRPVKLAMARLERFASEGAASDGPLLPVSEESDGELAEKISASMQEDYYLSPGKGMLAARTAIREKRILQRTGPEKGYSLYVGIPFCPSICLYCSFASSPIALWESRVDDYLDALTREIEASRDIYAGKKLTSVYIGGGTPTTLTASQLERLITQLEKNFDLGSVLEFTVEAGRPDSITADRLQVLRDHRVSRISINPQTMNDRTLVIIGRRHTVRQTVEAYELARKMGFDNINMDLIVGLPGEGYDEVDHTMRQLEALSPDDITIHALALKRASRLKLMLDEYSDDSFRASDAIMDRAAEGCEALGMSPYYLYRQKNIAGNYENVGYAKEGKAGLYNILIMEQVQTILGLGACASTKAVLADGTIERIENVKDVRSYIERIDEMIARKDRLRSLG